MVNHKHQGPNQSQKLYFLIIIEMNRWKIFSKWLTRLLTFISALNSSSVRIVRLFQLFAVLRPDVRVTSFTSLSHVFCFNGVTVTKWSKLLKPHFHRNYQEKFVPGTFFSPNSVANLLLSKVLWRLGNLVWWHRTARDV